MALTLSIVHHVFLTKEERYALANGLAIDVVGVSWPVWSSTTFTTDPAEEVFCNYTILSNLDPFSISRTSNGYLITIPSKSNYKPPIYPSNEVWRSVPMAVKETWYDKHQAPPIVKNLLDPKDGGSAYIRFKCHVKMKHNDHLVNVFHYVELKDMQDLQDSMV